MSTRTLWERVAELSDRIALHVADTPGFKPLTPESNAELARALPLLSEAAALLERMAEREIALYHESPEATGASTH